MIMSEFKKRDCKQKRSVFLWKYREFKKQYKNCHNVRLARNRVDDAFDNIHGSRVYEIFATEQCHRDTRFLLVSYYYLKDNFQHCYQFIPKSITEVEKYFGTGMLRLKGNIACVWYDENMHRHMVRVPEIVLFDNFEGINIYELIEEQLLLSHGMTEESYCR